MAGLRNDQIRLQSTSIERLGVRFSLCLGEVCEGNGRAGGTAETDVGIGDGKSVACFVLPGLETMLSKTRRTSRLVTFEGLQSAASTKTGSLSSSFLLRPGEARQWAHRRKRFGVSWQKVGGNKTTKEQVFISVTAFGEWRLRRKTQEDKESIGGQPGGRGQGTPRAGRMSDAKNLPSLLRFGAFEVSFESRELRKRGMRIQLEEKPFQILETLIESAGQVVRRKTLCEKLWPDTYVAFDHSLNTAVNKLRSVLGDLAQSPRFIETRPRLGYCFVAPVERLAGHRPAMAARAPNEPAVPVGHPAEQQTRRLVYGATGSRFQPSTTSLGVVPASEELSKRTVTDFFSPGNNEK